MSFEYFIGGRYLRAKQKQALITIITVLSIAGIAIGVMALLVVMAVMKGLEDDLRKGILGGQAHVLLKREDGAIAGYHRLVKEIEKINGVEATTPFSDVQGMLRSKYSFSPAKIKGIDPSTAGRVKNIYKARKIAELVDAKLGLPYQAQDWMQLNQSIFQAMKGERHAMFILLTMIILVAAVSITSSLIMLVIGKTRDIAILKTMGATNKSIRKIFVFSGMVICLIGTSLGLGLGLLLCTILKNYDITRLTGGVFYLMKTVPVKHEIFNIISIISVTLVICFLATLYPAHQAAKTSPVDTFRNS